MPHSHMGAGYRPASSNNQPGPVRLTRMDLEILVYSQLARHGIGVLMTLGSQGSRVAEEQRSSQ